jgi:hypothetical protein
MKKLVFLIVIGLVPNLVAAAKDGEAGEWPTFSNDPSALNIIKDNLMHIDGQTLLDDPEAVLNEEDEGVIKNKEDWGLTWVEKDDELFNYF